MDSGYTSFDGKINFYCQKDNTIESLTVNLIIYPESKYVETIIYEYSFPIRWEKEYVLLPNQSNEYEIDIDTSDNIFLACFLPDFVYINWFLNEIVAFGEDAIFQYQYSSNCNSYFELYNNEKSAKYIVKDKKAFVFTKLKNNQSEKYGDDIWLENNICHNIDFMFNLRQSSGYWKDYLNGEVDIDSFER